MKVLHFNIHEEFLIPELKMFTSYDGQKYYAFTAGEEGRNRWLYKLRLDPTDFPVNNQINVEETEFGLKKTNYVDKFGNQIYFLTKNSQPGQIIIWDLPLRKGKAEYRTEGNVSVIARGVRALGYAGRVGQADSPVLLVTGPCKLHWQNNSIATCDENFKWTSGEVEYFEMISEE